MELQVLKLTLNRISLQNSPLGNHVIYHVQVIIRIKYLSLFVDTKNRFCGTWEMVSTKKNCFKSKHRLRYIF